MVGAMWLNGATGRRNWGWNPELLLLGVKYYSKYREEM